MKKISITIFILLLLFCNFSYAHKGRTDGYGGHYNRSTGTYHYHSGEYADTGEYTSPIEEGGTLIGEENDSEDTAGYLVINNTDTSQQDKIDSLQQQIYSKESSIGNLTEQLNEKNEKINQLEDDKTSLLVAFGLILLLAICISYNVGLEKNKK